jgi:RimJ/RimL family protein N-acetyltransferase
VGASTLPGGKVEVGYGIGEAWQGQGLAQAALRLWLHRLAEAQVAPELWGVVEADNLASVGVLKGVGFQAEGQDARGRLLWRWVPPQGPG